MERRLKQDPAGTRPPPPLHPPAHQQPPVKREPRDDGRPMGYHDGEDSELDYGNEGPRKEPRIKQLNISNSYVPTWGCSEAFRESYQNWRDGIIASFNLEWSQFQANCTESNRVILISAAHPKTQDLLGFIRFEYDQNGLSVDGLKMVNFSATLEYQMLGIGTTTKAKNSNQAGQHGEGLKLSALVFRRNNYNFCIESGEQNWDFIFEKGELTCKIHEMRDKDLTLLRDKEKGKPRTFVFRPWDDVCVTVGASGLSRRIDNKFVTGNRISVDQVRKWLKITLDVNPPKEIIRTVKGDIIRNPEYRGQMYLRGLLLPNGGVTQQPYAYGYNFHEGHTSRDRSSLSSSGEETNRITAIWEAAMRADQSPQSEVVAEYANLLQNSLNKKSDVMLGTGRCLSKDNTKRNGPAFKARCSCGGECQEPVDHPNHDGRPS